MWRHRHTAEAIVNSETATSGTFDFRSVLRKTNLLEAGSDEQQPAPEIQQVDFRSVLRRKAVSWSRDHRRGYRFPSNQCFCWSGILVISLWNTGVFNDCELHYVSKKFPALNSL